MNTSKIPVNPELAKMYERILSEETDHRLREAVFYGMHQKNDLGFLPKWAKRPNHDLSDDYEYNTGIVLVWSWAAISQRSNVYRMKYDNTMYVHRFTNGWGYPSTVYNREQLGVKLNTHQALQSLSKMGWTCFLIHVRNTCECNLEDAKSVFGQQPLPILVRNVNIKVDRDVNNNK